jgi:hypothetical protein
MGKKGYTNNFIICSLPLLISLPNYFLFALHITKPAIAPIIPANANNTINGKLPVDDCCN